MRYVSLFSGIGGFDLALDRAGAECVLQAEIDPQACRVLAHHWPGVKRINDVRKVKPRRHSADLVCGGWPCQDLSVAGKRAGLAGERSGLFHQLIRVVDAIRPRWVFGENVPGLFSSANGRDFAIVLRELVQLGYGVAWRVLDSQYFGVPQRRRRVFLVGCLGDVRRAGAVLFESESCNGDSPPGRETRQGITEGAGGGSEGGCYVTPRLCRNSDSANEFGVKTDGLADCLQSDGPGAVLTGGVARCVTAGHGRRFDGETDDFVIGTLQAHSKQHGHAMGTQQAAECGQLVASTLRSRQHAPGVNAPGRGGEDDANLVTHSLRAAGADASEDGTGRGTPLVIPIDMRQASRGSKMTNNRREGSSGGAPGTGIGSAGDQCPTITDSHTPVVFSELGEGHHSYQESDQVRGLRGSSGCGSGKANLIGGVRRLTPTECLRLQAFPDTWLDLDPPLSDSAKYRMVGNAVTVAAVEWIARRIVTAHQESP